MSASYDNLNYDLYLNANNSLAALPSNNLLQPQFDANMDWSIINTPQIFNGAITDIKVSNLSASKLTVGTLTTILSVGGASVQIDGANSRIIVNDGTFDRVLIGYQQNGF